VSLGVSADDLAWNAHCARKDGPCCARASALKGVVVQPVACDLQLAGVTAHQCEVGVPIAELNHAGRGSSRSGGNSHFHVQLDIVVWTFYLRIGHKT
jgi:hypothetical protein